MGVTPTGVFPRRFPSLSVKIFPMSSVKLRVPLKYSCRTRHAIRLTIGMKMPGRPIEEITRLLKRWSDGEQSAVNELMPLVYDELRRVALGYLRHERGNISLQPTVLVHEFYLRIADRQNVQWQSRAQFF